MYEATVNNKNKFQIRVSGKENIVDGTTLNPDWESLGNGRYNLILNNKSYNAELIGIDRAAKVVKLRLNHKSIEVQLKDSMDLVLDKMGLTADAGVQLNDIKAPMPGLILNIMVTQGQEVQEGDPLLILEAMKMENILKSPGAGTVKEILVNKGDSVEKSQVLIQF